MAKKIKCIVKRPDEQFGHVTWVSDSLENLQKTVGGYIETVTLDNGLVLICNEEGKLRDMPYNLTTRKLINSNAFGSLYGQFPIFGTVIACGAEEDQLTDVPIDFNEWKALLCEWGN
jgi:hypothetical protein